MRSHDEFPTGSVVRGAKGAKSYRSLSRSVIMFRLNNALTKLGDFPGSSAA